MKNETGTDFSSQYDFSEDENKVHICSGSVEVCIDGKIQKGTGEVCLKYFPRAGIIFYCELDNDYSSEEAVSLSFNALNSFPTISSFFINGCCIDGWGSSLRYDSGKTYITWNARSEPITGVGNESTKMSSVVFHLLNFEDFCCARGSCETRRVSNGTVQRAIQHIDLINSKWKIEIKSHWKTNDNFKSLQKEGGYQLTHIGQIVKANGSQFSGKEAAECLVALRFFLSLAKGAWCNPICSVGFDADGHKVWESWASPQKPWSSALQSWFSRRHGKQLEEFFPCFMNLWQNPNWQTTLREIIYWYVKANDSDQGIDVGIMLTQTAIERLSFERIVNTKHLLTMHEFKSRNASDRFRLLFSDLNIKFLDILPKDCPLDKLATTLRLDDLPHALTEVRNSLVHPYHRYRGRFKESYFDAWRLGLWYLELVILAVCGYSGTYQNRITAEWVWDVEDVPWK